jgi:hypothetical protein
MTSRGTRGGGVDWTSTERRPNCAGVYRCSGSRLRTAAAARAVAALLSAAPALRANQTATFAIR